MEKDCVNLQFNLLVITVNKIKFYYFAVHRHMNAQLCNADTIQPYNNCLNNIRTMLAPKHFMYWPHIRLIQIF
jgi:hypothetical protein